MNKDVVKPFGDKILVKRNESETITKGGLFIPSMATEEQVCGTVIDVGPGFLDDKGYRHPMEVKPGDKVWFTKNAVIEVQHNGSEHLVMRQDRVLLIEL